MPTSASDNRTAYRSGVNLNSAHWSNPELDQQLDQLDWPEEPEERKALVQRAGKTTAALALMRFLPPREYVFGRYRHQLSGGMQQRVVIAIALVSNLELLVPTVSSPAAVHARLAACRDGASAAAKDASGRPHPLHIPLDQLPFWAGVLV